MVVVASFVSGTTGTVESAAGADAGGCWVTAVLARDGVAGLANVFLAALVDSFVLAIIPRVFALIGALVIGWEGAHNRRASKKEDGGQGFDVEHFEYVCQCFDLVV